MSHLSKTFLALAFSTMAASAALAQTVEFKPAPEINPAEPAPKIIGGVPVSGAKWRATYISASPISGNQSIGCTATVIGPQVVLTAAHCVPDNGLLVIEAINVRARCTHHGGYSEVENYANDIALCANPSPIQLPGNARYERLNINPAYPLNKSRVRLLGYGCTTPGGDMSSTLYTGTTNVAGKSTGKIALSGGVQLCPGDSGGAAYVENAEETRRAVVGVNSTVATNYAMSFLTNVAAPGVADFIVQWKTQNGLAICGYDHGHCYP